jgi:hypothetical protein
LPDCGKRSRRGEAKDHQKQEAWKRGEKMLAELAPGTRDQLFAKAKEQFLAELPWAKGSPDGTVARSIIREMVLEKLRGEGSLYILKISVVYRGETYAVLYILEDSRGKISYCCAPDFRGKKIWIADDDIELIQVNYPGSP